VIFGGLLIALILVTWGAQPAVTWRLRTGEEAARRHWAVAALAATFAGALAALLYVESPPDAALAIGLFRPLATLPGRLLVLLFPVQLAVGAVLFLARARLDQNLKRLGWTLAAGLSLLFFAAACFAAELLRTGEGPAGTLPQICAGAAGWLVVGLGAGEALLPGDPARAARPLFAVPAGLLFPAYYWTLPEAVQQAVRDSGAWITLAACAALLLVVRWLPAGLRRPGLVAAALLAGLFLQKVAMLSQSLGNQPLPPLGPLPISP